MVRVLDTATDCHHDHLETRLDAEDNFFRIAEGIDPATFISRFKGTAIVTLRTLVDAASANHLVDVREAYNAASDPDLSDEVGRVPSFYGEVDPAFKLQAATASGSGPFNW